ALADDLRRAGIYLGLAWALALALLIVARLARATAAHRRAAWPVLAPGAAYLALVAATFAASLDRGFLWNGTLERGLWLGEAAARLALENERLQAEVRARLDELRASRARIVEAGDRERSRLERDLHDGAQQRLVALVLSVRLLRSRLSSGADSHTVRRLDEAE